MIYKHYQPTARTEAFVQRYELRHFRFNGVANLPFKPFPASPYPYLHFYPKGFETMMDPSGDRSLVKKDTALSPLFSHRYDRYVSEEFMLITVILNPGILHCLGGMGMREMVDQHLDADEVFGNCFRIINEKLQAVEDYPTLIAMVDDFLYGFMSERMVTAKLPMAQLIGSMVADPSGTGIEQIASAACLSFRQFERHFIAYTGLCPRSYQRIARFHYAYTRKLQRPEWDWLRIAMEAGYTDYQHLAKDFKVFAGTTPPKYFKEDENAPGKLLGLRK